jgi:hypothetical protein
MMTSRSIVPIVKATRHTTLQEPLVQSSNPCGNFPVQDGLSRELYHLVSQAEVLNVRVVQRNAS